MSRQRHPTTWPATGSGFTPRDGPHALARLAAVSFDVTGTLLGLPRLGSIYAEVFQRHGLEAAPPEIEQAVRQAWSEKSIGVRLGEDRFSSHPEGPRGFWRDLVARVALLLELPAPSPFVSAELFDRFARPDSWQVFADVEPALGVLREAGLRLAVVSNFDERLPRLLAGLGLAEHFDSVVWSSRVGVEKPHPAIFEEMLHDLGMPPARVLHVGDSRRGDVEGAQALGMGALWLVRGGDQGDLADLGDLPAELGIE
ncbi:MAG TPA: HAD-IA family hydrolase [Thermoanaerobaculia bacterium]|nr:HAD-IA family hydrolase [Thermoanaerobaculia bacterium]